MIKLYGVPSCQQIRKSKALFTEKNIDFEFINVKKQPLSASLLQEAIKQVGLQNLINKKGTTYRKLGLKEQNPDDAEMVQWLLREQAMIKRPLIEKDGKFWVGINGFDAEQIMEFIDSEDGQ